MKHCSKCKRPIYPKPKGKQIPYDHVKYTTEFCEDNSLLITKWIYNPKKDKWEH